MLLTVPGAEANEPPLPLSLSIPTHLNLAYKLTATSDRCAFGCYLSFPRPRPDLRRRLMADGSGVDKVRLWSRGVRPRWL